MVFYTVVVIYNQDVETAETCKYLQQIKNHDIQLIIVDNSNIYNENEKKCKVQGWTYLNMKGNAGLSKAYNLALDYLNGKNGVIIWFDDDTHVTQQYFDELENKLMIEKKCDIFAPVIQGQDGRFWSPNEAFFLRNRQLKNSAKKISNRRFNAINSCTAVKLEIYKKYRYDERLFLDQVDHLFFYDQRKLKRNFCQLDTVIQHNFSLKSKMESIEAIKKRYEIMIPDFLTFCSRNRWVLCLGYIKVLGWGFREAKRYKSPEFIIWCIKKQRLHLIKSSGKL